MNKFITTDVGGLPITLDDFRFIDDSVRNAFFGFSGAFGSATEDGFTLQGAGVTFNGLSYDVAAGYIAYGGEIFEVLAHNVAAPGVGETLIWRINTSNDPAGNKTFDSGGTFDTYQLRRASVISFVAVASSLPAVGTPTIHEKIAELSGPTLGAWTTIDLNGSTDVVQNNTPTGGGADTATVLPPVAGDYLRYNIVGNVVNLVWKFSTRTTTAATAAANSILIKGLPFTFENIDQSGAYMAYTNTAQNGLTGMNECFNIPNSNVLGFKLVTIGGNEASFNRFYVFEPSGDTALDATAATAQEFTWSIRGNATFVIQ